MLLLNKENDIATIREQYRVCDELLKDRLKNLMPKLLKDAKILINQGTPYGEQGKGHIRIVTACFASDEDAMERFMRIRKVLQAMAQEKGLV